MLHNLMFRNKNVLRRGFSLLMAFFALFSGLLPAFAQEVKLYEEVEGFPVTRGAQYQAITRFTSLGWQKIHVLKVDLQSDNIDIDSLSPSRGYAARESLSKMVQESGAVAGINGDFFIMATPSAPLGVQIQEGRILSSPSPRKDMASFGLTWDHFPAIFYAEFEGKVLSSRGASFDIGGINKLGDGYGKIFIYTRDFGENTPTTSYTDVTFAIIINHRVVDIFEGSTAVIPEDGMVLMARGPAAAFIREHLDLGDPLHLELNIVPDISALKMALGGGAVLVEDGKIPASFSHNIAGNNPRSAVGFSADKRTMYLVAVDGRQGLSRGMTQKELAQLMLELGATDALNLDGGGSTTMVLRPLGEENTKVVNSVSGGTQRLIANGIGIFSKSAPGSVHGLRIFAKSFNIPLGGHRAFEVTAYDENYNPVPVDASKIQWSVDQGLGSFEGNVFTGAKSGVGTVTARLGNIVATQSIRVLEDTRSLKAVPESLQLKPGGKASIDILATDTRGFTAPVDPMDLGWEIVGEIGAMVGSEFIASSEGSGAAMASFSGKKVGVLVQVSGNGDLGFDQSLLPKASPLYHEANNPDKSGSLNFGALGFSLSKDAAGAREKTQAKALELIKNSSYNVIAGPAPTLELNQLKASGSGYSTHYQGDTLFVFMDTSKGGIRETNYHQWIKFRLDMAASKGKAKTVFVVMDRTPDSFTDKLEGDLLKKLLTGFAQDHGQDIWVIGGRASKFSAYIFEGVHYLSLPGADAKEPSLVLFNVGRGKVSYRVVPLIEAIQAEATGAKKGRTTELKIYGIAPGGQKVPLGYPYAVDWKLSTDKLGSFDGKTMAFDAKETGSLKITASTAGVTSTFDVNITDLTVMVKGIEVFFPDQQPYIDEHQRTLVPVRFVSESLGAQVHWDDPTKTVTIVQNGSEIKLKIGESSALVNGEPVAFDTKAVVTNGRTMVPLRFVSEGLGAKVHWDDPSRTVFIQD